MLKDNIDEYRLDGGPIETLEHAAMVINLLVIQGSIKAVDQEGQVLLDHLGNLVETHEDIMRQGVTLAS